MHCASSARPRTYAAIALRCGPVGQQLRCCAGLPLCGSGPDSVWQRWLHPYRLPPGPCQTLSHVVTQPRRAATLRVAGASEGCRFAAAGPNNVRQARRCLACCRPAVNVKMGRNVRQPGPKLSIAQNRHTDV